MVTFSVNEPMTSKNANNSSTAMFETNKVVAKLGTGMFYVFEAKKKIKMMPYLMENVLAPNI